MPDRKKIVEICHRVYAKGFVSAYDGNISAVTPDNTFLITRSGVCKGDLTEDDILEIDGSGKIISGKGKLTTEFKIHLFTYARRPEVNSVIHCHPVFATAFAIRGETLDKNVFPELILTLGKVPLCTYATPSTDNLALSMEPHINYAWALLFQNHGAVTLGKDIYDAYFKMEKLEHAAKTIFFARILGGEKELDPAHIKELISISEESYGIKPDIRNIL